MDDFLRFRRAKAEDVQFIIATWIQNYKGSHQAGLLSIPEFTVPCRCGEPIRYDFSAVMELTLAKLLQRPGLTVWVAFDPQERPPNDLYGCIVSETEANVPEYRWVNGKYEVYASTATIPTVHWVYVKEAYRRHGLARELFRVAGINPRKPYLYTCRTALLTHIERAGRMPEAKFFPLSARFSK